MGPSTTTSRETAPLIPISTRSPLLAVTFTAAPALLFVASILVPYYVNDLDSLPLAEVASGAHDPMGLWPQGAAGGWVQLAAGVAIALTPLGAVIGAGLSATAIARGARRGPDRSLVARAAVVLTLSIAVLATYFSPVGSALVSWRLD